MDTLNQNTDMAARNAQIELEAAEWIDELVDPLPTSTSPFEDLEARNAAFSAWVQTSPDHARHFIGFMELSRRLEMLDRDEVRKLVQISDSIVGERINPAVVQLAHGIEQS